MMGVGYPILARPRFGDGLGFRRQIPVQAARDEPRSLEIVGRSWRIAGIRVLGRKGGDASGPILRGRKRSNGMNRSSVSDSDLDQTAQHHVADLPWRPSPPPRHRRPVPEEARCLLPRRCRCRRLHPPAAAPRASRRACRQYPAPVRSRAGPRAKRVCAFMPALLKSRLVRLNSPKRRHRSRPKAHRTLGEGAGGGRAKSLDDLISQIMANR